MDLSQDRLRDDDNDGGGGGDYDDDILCFWDLLGLLSILAKIFLIIFVESISLHK
jgi:hypothetical protein